MLMNPSMGIQTLQRRSAVGTVGILGFRFMH